MRIRVCLDKPAIVGEAVPLGSVAAVALQSGAYGDVVEVEVPDTYVPAPWDFWNTLAAQRPASQLAAVGWETCDYVPAVEYAAQEQFDRPPGALVGWERLVDSVNTYGAALDSLGASLDQAAFSAAQAGLGVISLGVALQPALAALEAVGPLDEAPEPSLPPATSVRRMICLEAE